MFLDKNIKISFKALLNNLCRKEQVYHCFHNQKEKEVCEIRMRENDEMKNYNLVYFYVYGFIVRGRVRLIDNSGQIVTFFASVHYFS